MVSSSRCATRRCTSKHEVQLCSAPFESRPDVWAMPAFTRPYEAGHFAERGRHPQILDALPDLSMPRDGA